MTEKEFHILLVMHTTLNRKETINTAYNKSQVEDQNSSQKQDLLCVRNAHTSIQTYILVQDFDLILQVKKKTDSGFFLLYPGSVTYKLRLDF